MFLELDLIVAVDCYGHVQGGGLTAGIVALVVKSLAAGFLAGLNSQERFRLMVGEIEMTLINQLRQLPSPDRWRTCRGVI